MNNNLIARRIIQLGALFLIGDGVMGLLKPRWRFLLGTLDRSSPKPRLEELAEHPNSARAIYFLEAAVGVAIARGKRLRFTRTISRTGFSNPRLS